jgi:hypothetical protein
MQGDNWNDLLKEVVTFDSVEEFWGVYVSSFSVIRDCHTANNPSRTTSQYALTWASNQTTISSKRVYDQNGRIPKTNMAESGAISSRTRER